MRFKGGKHLTMRDLAKPAAASAALLLLLGAHSSLAEVVHEPGFRIETPAGFAIAKTRGPDFDVYRVSRGSVGYVGIYVGFAPDFPGNKTATVATVGKRKTASVMVAGKAEPVEWLIPGKQGQLHVWIMKPPVGQEMTARAMALSVTPE